ncbi:MAG: T9SS type A sorting domain-containing protein, partial [Bacteroidia bacterium]
VAFTPTATSTYTVNGKDANGCTNSGNITITVNALPIITILENPDSATICSGTIITLNGQGATNYTWTNGITDGVAFTPTATSTYTVTGSDSNGCNNSDTITVNVNNCTTGIANLTENGAQIFVYPNPVRDILTFRSNNRIGPVSIYDCLNNLIYQNTINSFQANIDLIEIPEGVYFVKVQGKYIKILKQ